MVKTRLISILFLLALPALLSGQSAPDTPQTVYSIAISGEVSPGMSAFVKRALHDIPPENAGSTVIILKMDTFGGRVDAALMIVDLIAGTDKGTTVALVTQKAISAGALIALACDELFMLPHTTIGDCAPIMVGSEGPQMLGEKFQSPLRAKFRSLAKKNGYSEVLAEAMVTADMKVYRVVIDGRVEYMDALAFEELGETAKARVTEKKTVVDKGELLTMDNIEAKELGFSEDTVADAETMLAGLGVRHDSVIALTPTWTESLMRFVGSIGPLLLMIGLGALYTEIKAPGFGVPGIVGIICLSLFLMNQYTVGLAGYTELLIILLGIVLIGFEYFVIPGFGLAGISGGLCLALGLVLSLQGFTWPDPARPWQTDLMIINMVQVLGAIIIAFLSALGVLRYVVPKISRVTKRTSPYLETTLKNYHADSLSSAGVRAGETGLAATALRPSGKMDINDTLYDVVTEGEFLEKGTPVKILDVRGNILVVAKANGEKT